MYFHLVHSNHLIFSLADWCKGLARYMVICFQSCVIFFPIRRKFVKWTEKPSPSSRKPRANWTSHNTSSYPAFCFYWFDEWGPTHGLGLNYVVIQQQLNVINCTQDVCILQTNMPRPVRITRHSSRPFHADSPKTHSSDLHPTGTGICVWQGMEFLFSSLKMFLKTHIFYFLCKNLLA